MADLFSLFIESSQPKWSIWIGLHFDTALASLSLLGIIHNFEVWNGLEDAVLVFTCLGLCGNILPCSNHVSVVVGQMCARVVWMANFLCLCLYNFEHVKVNVYAASTYLIPDHYPCSIKVTKHLVLHKDCTPWVLVLPTIYLFLYCWVS